MIRECTIAGRKVELQWDQQSAKRYAFRMGELGGEPTTKQLNNPRTVATALFKVLWAMLPASEFIRYDSPESLFVTVDHDQEAEGIYAAITGIYSDRFTSDEKKSTSKTSHSPESNSD